MGVSQQSILAFAPRDPIVPFFGDWSMLPLWIHSFSTLNKYFTEIQLLYLIHERLNGNIRSNSIHQQTFWAPGVSLSNGPRYLCLKSKHFYFRKYSCTLTCSWPNMKFFSKYFFILFKKKNRYEFYICVLNSDAFITDKKLMERNSQGNSVLIQNKGD
jgi:hypothetical protein